MDAAHNRSSYGDFNLPSPDLAALFAALRAPCIGLLPDDPDFTIIAASDAYLKAVNKTREDIVGSRLFEFLGKARLADSATLQNLRTSFHRVIATGQPDTMPVQNYDVSHFQAEGAGRDQRYCRLATSPVLGPDGAVRLIIHSIEDMTESMALDRLRESENRFGAIVEQNPFGLLIGDLKGGIEYCNPATLRMLGYTSGEVAAGLVRWDQITPPEFSHLDAEALRQLTETGSCVPYEKVYVAKDGQRIPILMGASILPVPNGEPAVAVFLTDLTLLRKAEEDLRLQWQIFDTALSHTPDFTYTFDLEGRFTYVNRALLALWQKPLEAALGKNFLELGYPPVLAERLRIQIQQVIDTKRTIRDHTPFTGPTGETRHYEYIFVPVLAASGVVEAVAGSTRDITERSRGEELAKEDQRRWRELLFQTPAAIAVLRGPEHRFEWVNADYIKMVGRPESALLGKTVLEALPEVESQAYINILNGVYETGEPFKGHESLARIDRGDGVLDELYVNFISLATRDISGSIDGIFVHVTDVTDMVLSRQRIEESERQFRTLAETIPHLAWMADETGYIFWYNRRWYDYTGTTLEQMEGWGWQRVHDPEVLPNVLTQWKTAIASGNPFDMIFPLKGADGVFRAFLTRVEPVKDNEGRVVRWFGTNTDVTEQRTKEEKLARMNRQLEEFAYVASHDLQEPLRTVNIYTQLLLKRIPADDVEAQKSAAFIRQGVKRMESLIKDLLTFSRTVHEDEAPVGTADLSISFSEALAVLKTHIEETGAVICAKDLPTVQGDTAQLTHVFQNLLSNSLKYRKPDVVPEVCVSAEEDGDKWVVSVRDNGIGFQPQYAKRIFGLFKRLHADDYPGTGLGLAICQRTVERCGGRMWAEGRPHDGATFFFTLPKAKAQ